MLINTILLRLTTKRDQELLLEVYRLISVSYDYVQTLPKNKTPTYRCHTICRALASRVQGLSVCDGIYVGAEPTEKRPANLQARQARHSWLVTPDKAIIDPYPVGVIACGSPLFIGSCTKAICAFWQRFVHSGRKRYRYSDDSQKKMGDKNLLRAFGKS
jgi:hypothetical protein